MINEILNTFSKSILTLPRYAKQIIALITDSALCIITVWLAFYLKLDQFISLKGNYFWTAVISVFFAIPIFWLFGFYRTMFRYSGKSVLVSISFALLVYAMIYFSCIAIYSFDGVPRSIGILQPLILFFAIAGSRLLVRFLLGSTKVNKFKKSILPRALIYGAGSAGRQLASALDNSYEMKVVGFIDDDTLLHGQVLQGQNIYSYQDLAKVIESKDVTHILLALPSINRSKRMKIIKKVNQHKIIVRTLPSVTDLVEERVTTSDIRDLEVEDILDRHIVEPNLELLAKNTNSKIVLVTGAGGSIGSELTRQIIKLNPKKILLIDISEYALYQIHSELEEIKLKNKLKTEPELIPIIASVQDKLKMTEIIKNFKPDIVYHAAAYKHVPLVEQNICEGIKNNIFGTLNVSKISIDHNISNFVLISSDKAVRPTNIMGASKRVAELCLQALFEEKNSMRTKLSIVRFGNVLGSSGSVIPKFKKQIKDGGPVTLTHPEVTRYFMTIPEAAQLVIQAGAMAQGGDVFVLDMGDPVKIKDLVKKIVILSGLTLKDKENPNGDIKIVTTGLRPGEKLYEEVLLGDNPQPTIHKKIQKTKDPFIPWHKLSKSLTELKQYTDEEKIYEIIDLMQKIVTGYNFNGEIVDQIFLKKNNQKYNRLKNQSLIKNYDKQDKKVIRFERN